MAQSIILKWPRGEDLNIQLSYKEGNNASSSKAIDLSTNYALRMDLVDSDTGTPVFSFLSSTQPGALGTGRGGEPNINIFLPRSLTLPGGALTNGGYAYDMFLRNTLTNRQIKILKGYVNLEASNTLWV